MVSDHALWGSRKQAAHFSLAGSTHHSHSRSDPDVRDLYSVAQQVLTKFIKDRRAFLGV